MNCKLYLPSNANAVKISQLMKILGHVMSPLFQNKRLPCFPYMKRCWHPVLKPLHWPEAPCTSLTYHSTLSFKICSSLSGYQKNKTVHHLRKWSKASLDICMFVFKKFCLHY